MRCCVVIPTYNEAQNIDDLIEILLEHEDVEVVVVDDSSPDGTFKRVLDWEDKSNGRVHLIKRLGKLGLRRAYIEGFKYALQEEYEIVAQMDADLSHDPKVLDNLVGPIRSGEADFVLGSRYILGGSIPKWAWYRRFLSRAGNSYARRILGLSIRDTTSGYRAYSSSLLKRILDNEIRAEGYGFQIEMAYVAKQLNARTLEVPISFTERVHGKSKMGTKIIFEALILVTFGAIRRLF